MNKIFVRIIKRENFIVYFETMDGKHNDNIEEKLFEEFFRITNIKDVFEVIPSAELEKAVELLDRKCRWLIPHTFTILRILHKQEKNESLDTTDYLSFGTIVKEFCAEFNETQIDFINTVNHMKRLLQGDK